MPLSLEKLLEHVMEEHDDGSDSDGLPGLVDSDDSEADAPPDLVSESESEPAGVVDDDADGKSAAVSTNSGECPQGPKRRRFAGAMIDKNLKRKARDQPGRLQKVLVKTH